MAKLEKNVQKFIIPYPTDSGQRWRVRIPDGNGGQIRKRSFLSKTDATEFAATVFLKVMSQTKGTRTVRTTLLFKEYSEQWLENKSRNGVSEATRMRYGEHIKLRLIPYFGFFKLDEIEKFHLRNFINAAQTEGSSSALLRHSVSVFKSIMKQAEIDDLISHKGISVIPTPKHKNKKPEFWDYSQTSYFLNATNESNLHDLWKVALFSGMRAGEITGLKWDCVHLDKSFGSYQGAIEVRRSFNQKTRLMQETTKNGDRRIIPILPEAREVFLRLKQSAGGEFVFGGKAPLDSSHFSRQLKTELSKLPLLPQISFHKLRHTFCSYLDSTGMNRRIVSQIMGHRDLSTTDRYSHVNDQMLGNEMNRWLENQNQQKTSKLKTVNF